MITRRAGVGASLALLVMVTAGCNTQTVRTTEFRAASAGTTPPTDEVYDIGIELFAPNLEGLGGDVVSSPAVREAEARYMPQVLKRTLQETGQWGAVRIIPERQSPTDLWVAGEILRADGETLKLRITVSDAAGERWYTRNYTGTASKYAYDANLAHRAEPFQAVYNDIANDLLEAARARPPGTAERLRTIAELDFARRFVPEAFDGYLVEEGDGTLAVDRLPAENDPNLERVRRVRERDFLYVDTLQAYYDDFAERMHVPYRDWRAEVFFEAQALEQVERKATARQIGGALAIIGGVLGALSGTGIGNAAAIVGVTSGASLMKSGLDARAEAQIHAAALRELSDSLDAELEPRTVKLADQVVTLRGTAEEQYAQWRELLRRIYVEETGGPVNDAGPAGEPGPDATGTR